MAGPVETGAAQYRKAGQRQRTVEIVALPTRERPPGPSSAISADRAALQEAYMELTTGQAGYRLADEGGAER